MRIHIGGDHAAFETQQALLTYLTEQGHEVINHGPSEYDAEDDYPVYVPVSYTHLTLPTKRIV